MILRLWRVVWWIMSRMYYSSQWAKEYHAPAYRNFTYFVSFYLLSWIIVSLYYCMTVSCIIVSLNHNMRNTTTIELIRTFSCDVLFTRDEGCKTRKTNIYSWQLIMYIIMILLIILEREQDWSVSSFFSWWLTNGMIFATDSNRTAW